MKTDLRRHGKGTWFYYSLNFAHRLENGVKLVAETQISHLPPDCECRTLNHSVSAARLWDL